jgi:hypothetical protein
MNDWESRSNYRGHSSIRRQAPCNLKRDLESAIVPFVSPAGYTAILRGKAGRGIAVAQIYNLKIEGLAKVF